MMRAVAVLAASATITASVSGVAIGLFSRGELDGWSEKSFLGHTAYSIVELDGRHVLKARSERTASGLYRRVHVNLDETPVLHWSWRVENTLDGIDETTKAGDDYPARVYVVFSGGLFFWRTHAINYVWASRQPRGASWPNAFTANARMIAVRSGDAEAGSWRHEQRNVRQDYRRLFGHDVRKADAVAIMTDTDNSRRSATAYYGDIYFTSE